MFVFDIEADGFLEDMTTVHCLNVVDRTTGTPYRFNNAPPGTPMHTKRTGTIEEGLALLEAAPIGGHNVLEYDIPAIQKVYPKWAPRGHIRDSRAEGRMIWTELKDRDFGALRKGVLPPEFQKNGLIGLQSLEAWGYRMGEHKGSFDGPWETFTEEMDDYCAQDIVVNCKLFDIIDSKQYDQRALDIENGTARIIDRQVRHGFGFNVEKALQLVVRLQKRRLELEDDLRKAFKPWYRPVAVKGSTTFTPKRDDKKKGYLAGVPFTKMELAYFNPGSRLHIADRLTKLYAWKPVEFTPQGDPKIDETTLDGMEFPEAKLLKEYLTVEKRLGQLAEGKQAWLKAVKDDGRIHGRVNTNGAVTGRMTHNSPNVGQVPACGAEYGVECRELFYAPWGWQVGCDAEGLELRCLSHYMAPWDGGAYGKAVVEGTKEAGTDPHSLTKKALRLNTRDSAKTWIYAFLYGAGNYKLGTIVLADMTEEQRAEFYATHPAGDQRDTGIAQLGARTRTLIAKGLPALGKLVDAVKHVVKTKGFLTGLDGRILAVRSQHAALNTLLQSAGAVVMKKALMILDSALQTEFGYVPGEDYEFMANVHDEFQAETKLETHAETIGRRAAQAITEAGDYFDFQCRLAGAYSVGKTWAETH